MGARDKAIPPRKFYSMTVDSMDRRENSIRGNWARNEPGKSDFLDEANLIHIHDRNLLYWLQTQ